MRDPVSGPMPKQRLRELADLPFGAARKAIQQYDPIWGLQPGEKIEFEVRVSGHMQGTAIVKAADQKEADALADKLNSGDVDWDDWQSDLEILSVEPYVRRKA